MSVVVIALLFVNAALFKMNRKHTAAGVNLAQKVVVFTGKVEDIKEVVLDTETGSYDTRLISTEGNVDRFTIPNNMQLVVGQSYEFTTKYEKQAVYPRAVDAVQK